MTSQELNRRTLIRQSVLTSAFGTSLFGGTRLQAQQAKLPKKKAQIAITLDLEMARNFPKWEDTHWDYEKGNLDSAAKMYSIKAANRVSKNGGRIHFFCVGQVLEQADVQWLEQLASEGHPIGNHTYDHVYLLAKKPEELQFRFQRSPWLIQGKSVEEVLRENIRMTTVALKQRAKIENRGFRTPGGFTGGLMGREDLQNMLLDLGFRWVSSKYPAHANSEAGVQPTSEILQNIVAAQNQAQPFVYSSGLIEIPMSPISDIGAFRNGRWKLTWFLEALGLALDWTIANGAVFDFLAHPSCLGVVDPELKAIDLICEKVAQSRGAAEIVDLDQIAATFKQ